MKTKRKTFKVVGIILGVSFLAAIGLSSWSRSDLITTEEESQKVVDAMNKEYAEDTYGGTTPEETIALFTEALKKEDTALASMYFLPEDRLENKKYLDSAVERENLSEILSDLGSGKLIVDGDAASFSVFVNGVKVAGMNLGKSPHTGRWKITEF